MTFKRQISYYIITIYIPTFMIVMVSWMSFWLDHKSVRENALMLQQVFYDVMTGIWSSSSITNSKLKLSCVVLSYEISGFRQGSILEKSSKHQRSIHAFFRSSYNRFMISAANRNSLSSLSLRCGARNPAFTLINEWLISPEAWFFGPSASIASSHRKPLSLSLPLSLVWASVGLSLSLVGSLGFVTPNDILSQKVIIISGQVPNGADEKSLKNRLVFFFVGGRE